VTSLTLPAGVLARIADVCLPCTGTDRLLPVFRCVRLFERDGNLNAESTDRYTVAVCRTDTLAPEGLDVMLDRDDLRAIIAAFKAGRRSQVVLNLEISDETVTVTLSEGMLAAGLDLTLKVKRGDGEFPKVARLYTAPAAAEPVACSPQFDAAYLRRLPAGPTRMRATQGDGQPVAFYGDDWAVVIMAQRPGVDLAAPWALQ